jgi:Tfp pilus assembly protein PilN
MNQQVNLYQVEKKVFKLTFNFQQSSYCLMAFLGVVALFSLSDLVRHFLVKKEYNVLGKEQREKTEKLQSIAGKMPEAQTRSEVITEVKRYQDQKQQKTEIIALLSNENSTKKGGFSLYFEALAKQAIPGIWLTNFSIKQNGEILALSGSTTSPTYVPLLIASLSDEAVFQGKTFGLFKISTDDKSNDMMFHLETKRERQP